MYCVRRIIVIGMQLAYYGAAVIKVRDYTFNTTNGHTYTPIPDWGWILGAVAGVLWLIIAGISACENTPSSPQICQTQSCFTSLSL
jgi:acyl-coenzyme A synthetase/AMP-(fatty) acid ligase